MKLYHLPLILILMCGCSSLKKTIIDSSLKPLDNSAEVVVIDIQQPMPDSCKLVGTLRYTEDASSPTKSYKQLIQNAKQEARAMGGNIIKVTNLQVQNSYVLDISVLYRQNIKDIDFRLQAIAESLHKMKFGEGKPTYAILYVYRPWCGGILVGYDIELNGKVICRVKNNTYYEIKLYQEGPSKIVAETESAALGMINVKFGEEYYLKCSLTTGVVVGVPVLQLMPNWQGSAEYEALKESLSKRSKLPQKVDDDSGN